MITFRPYVLALVVLAFGACTPAPSGATGTVKISVRGHEAMLEPTFVDGFEVTFDHILVVLVGFGLEGAEGEAADVSVDGVVVDLRNGTTVLWEKRAPVGSWSRASFRTRAARHSDRIVGDVGDNEIHFMLQRNYGVAFSGTATKDGEMFTFFLGVPAMRYEHCENGPNALAPITITEGSVTNVEIDFHLDHFFYSSLASEMGELRFEHLAAAALSNDVTNPFLSQRLEDIVDRNGDPIMDGAGPLVFDPSPFEISPPKLEQFFIAAGRTIGRVNGGGRCEATLD